MKLTNREGDLVEKSIVFDQVEYALGVQLLIKNLTVSLPLNEPLYIVGYNGAGKSLFLQLLIGFIRASNGRIVYSNQAWLNDSTQLSYSSQKVVLLNRSVFDNVDFVLKQANVKSHERKTRVLKALEFTNLLSKQNTNAQALSGGEQQRLSLARALASRSELIVLDEPTASLDPSAIKRYESYLKSLSKTASIIMVTHDLAQIKRLAEKISGNICFLEDGQCVELTNALSFLAKPKTDAAKSFLKAHSFW